MQSSLESLNSHWPDMWSHYQNQPIRPHCPCSVTMPPARARDIISVTTRPHVCAIWGSNVSAFDRTHHDTYDLMLCATLCGLCTIQRSRGERGVLNQWHTVTKRHTDRNNKNKTSLQNHSKIHSKKSPSHLKGRLCTDLNVWSTNKKYKMHLKCIRTTHKPAAFQLRKKLTHEKYSTLKTSWCTTPFHH